MLWPKASPLDLANSMKETLLPKEGTVLSCAAAAWVMLTILVPSAMAYCQESSVK